MRTGRHPHRIKFIILAVSIVIVTALAAFLAMVGAYPGAGRVMAGGIAVYAIHLALSVLFPMNLLFSDEEPLATGHEASFPSPRNQPGRETRSDKSEQTSAGDTILVADDVVMITSVIRTTLEKHGFRVLTASDLPAAGRLGSEHADQIAALILDVGLLRKRAAQDLAWLASERRKIPVVLISGKAEGPQALPLPAVPRRFLKKPFAIRELLEAIRDVTAPSRDA